MNYIIANDYENMMKTIAEPALEKIHSSGIHANGIYYDSYKITDPKATIIVSHGLTESGEKFKEVIYYFIQMGYSVYAVDHRGHGRSIREVEDSSLVHIERFDKYAEDLHDIIHDIVMKECEGPYYLYGHSMGGAISIRYLEKYPEDITKTVLSSPMTKILLKPLTERAAMTIAKGMCLAGHDKDYGPGQHPFLPGEKFEESASSNEARFRYYTNKRESTKEFQLSGSSYKWIIEAIKATRRLRSKKECEKIKTKVLLFESTNDTYVDHNGHKMFLNGLHEAEHAVMKNTKHEIYNSDDDIIKEYIERIEKFYNS